MNLEWRIFFQCSQTLKDQVEIQSMIQLIPTLTQEILHNLNNYFEDNNT